MAEVKEKVNKGTKKPVKSKAAPKVAEKKKVLIPSVIVVKDFAERLDMSPAEVITELMKNGIAATINEEIDFETAAIIAEDLGFEIEKEKEEVEITKKEGVRKKLMEEFAEADEAELKDRPPVVTVMGHVDHGKTKLLDAIRETNVIEEEAGGITQHIGAYQVREKGKLITFLDTPGHEAFTAMRERGAKVTDIAVLVVAADDGVKPQTKEAIEHIKKAGIPMVVAVNKIDKPGADPERVKKELGDVGIMPEEWGGDTICVNISAKYKKNLGDLLDMVLLVAEMENLKANPKAKAVGTVIESHKNSKRGIEATVLVQNGTLKLGDVVTVGAIFGKVRSMENFLGKKINHAKPSAAVRILGLEAVPEVGDVLFVEEGVEGARAKISRLKRFERPKAIRAKTEEEEGKIKKLNLIIKADVQGSLEAILGSLEKIKSDEVSASIISYGVGKITESDIMMAGPASALVVGFNTDITSVAKRLAEDLKVKIKTFDVIYDLIDEVKKRLTEMLEPEVVKTNLGKMEVLAIFRTEKGKMIVGGKVLSKHLENNSLAKVIREEKEVGRGKIASLQSGKVDVNKVEQGKECGIVFDGDVKIKVGDVLETWKEEVKKKIL
jgi:translation initiation factor IF-2